MKLQTLDDLDELDKLALINMSYSRLDSYEMCPSKYYFTYVQKEERVFGPAASLGNVVHGVLEDTVGDTLVYEDMLVRMDHHLEIYDPDKLIDEELLRAGRQMIQEFVDRHEEDEFDIIGKEKEFDLIIGSALVRGFIDLVTREKDGTIRITDYKAQPLDAPILTPHGWRRMRDIKEGDEVIGSNGSKVNVVGVYPQGVVPAYRVTFTDGTSTVCSDSHLWQASDMNKPMEVLSTTEILARGLRRGSNYKFAIPTVAPVEFDKQAELPIDPYVMGVILGDGGTTSGRIKIHAEDQEILDRVAESLPEGLRLVLDEEKVYRIASISQRNHHKQALDAYGLTGCRSWEKFIPEEYLRASVEDRYALLQGLMDTDGGTSTRTTFVTTSPRLRDGIVELLRSLGGLPRWSEHESYYRKGEEKIVCRTKYIVNTCIKVNPFYLPRKRAGFKERKYNDARRIKSIERIPDVEMQCIRVENQDGLYITNDYIVTHNSGKWEVAAKNIHSNLQVGLYSLAASIMYPDTPIYAELYYLRSGRRKGHLFTPEDMEGVYETVLEKVNTILDDRNFTATEDRRPCTFCDFAKTKACKTGAARMRRR